MTPRSTHASIQKTVYIAAYPRSGNTWVRLLLEHALGFRTTSVYPGEGRAFLETSGDTHLSQSPKLNLMKTHAKSVSGSHDVIYVLRDGRDATVDYWHYVRDWEKRPTGSFCDFLRSLYLSGDWWALHVYAWLKLEHAHRLLLVRYEDLHKDQERELRRILDFLGLQATRPFSDYAAAISIEILHARLPSFFRSGRVGEWRESFSPEDERFFLQHDLGLLAKYGYVREGGRPLIPARRPEISMMDLERDSAQPTERESGPRPTDDGLASIDLRSDPPVEGLGDIVLRSQIRRMIELERAVEEKEAVIQEQKRAIDALNAHMERCPLGRRALLRRAALGIERFVAAFARRLGRTGARR